MKKISLIYSFFWRLIAFAAVAAALLAALGVHVKTAIRLLAHKDLFILIEGLFAAIVLCLIALLGVLYVHLELRHDDEALEWDRTERLVAASGLLGLLVWPILNLYFCIAHPPGYVYSNIISAIYLLVAYITFSGIYWKKNSMKKLKYRYFLRHCDYMTDEEIDDILIDARRKKEDELAVTAADCIRDSMLRILRDSSDITDCETACARLREVGVTKSGYGVLQSIIDENLDILEEIENTTDSGSFMKDLGELKGLDKLKVIYKAFCKDQNVHFRHICISRSARDPFCKVDFDEVHDDKIRQICFPE